MNLMASSALKPLVARFINPIAALFLKVGLTPNAVTILGALGSVASSAYFFTQGRLFLGALAVSLFTLSDLFDGTMARLSDHGPSAWGGFLDSTLDRIVDLAIWISLSIYLIRQNDSIAPVALIALGTGLLIPYIRAKAESFGIDCTIGIAERTERLILALIAVGFDGLGVPYILTVGIWTSAILGAITIAQRMRVTFLGLKSK